MTDVADIAKGLSKAQRRLILAASAKRGKSFSTMKRHAKLSPIVPLLNARHLPACFAAASTGGRYQRHYVLSALGLEVRNYLAALSNMEA